MKLVIVESPTKAKTISKFLGKDYVVESSYGHIRDLPKSKLGIDTEHDFEPHYIVPLKAKPVLKNLKALAKKSDEVILATDEDREGEAIAWHLAAGLGLDEKTVPRIVFHEITKDAIESALKNPRTLDQNLINAQQARRVLDRLVGYKLSPFLWKKIMKGLSAGRVQSVTLRLIVERENEIRAFKPEEYWTIEAKLKALNSILETNLTHVGEKALEKFDIPTDAEAKLITNDLIDSNFTITQITKTNLKKNPPTPFITSTLQQESAKRLGYSSKKTMLLAQRLYELGLITYMRTDSVNLSQESLAAAKNFLQKEFGDRYASEAPRIFHTKSRVAQEAHEAIRPSNINAKPEDIAVDGEPERKVYKLIWQRFLGSQMPQALFDGTTIDVSAENPDGQKSKNYILRANGTMMRFDGFLKVWPQKFEEKELPNLEEKAALKPEEILPLQHFTEPPGRFTEASLIKTLEKFGIGRPSTYAPTISVIQIRNYVKKETGKFIPTEIGEMVNKVLTENFNEVVDIDFTAKMETSLDEVANGNERWQDLIGGFYLPFAKKLEEKYVDVKKELTDEPTDILCDKCGKPMVIKYGRFGKFIACTGFPECKNTKQLPKAAPKSTGLKCPDCAEGEIVERKVSRGRARGKIFWGCSKYPTCKYASWENPTGIPLVKPEKEPDTVVEEKEEPEETN